MASLCAWTLFGKSCTVPTNFAPGMGHAVRVNDVRPLCEGIIPATAISLKDAGINFKQALGNLAGTGRVAVEEDDRVVWGVQRGLGRITKTLVEAII